MIVLTRVPGGSAVHYAMCQLHNQQLDGVSAIKVDCVYMSLADDEWHPMAERGLF